jgi:hypothetical protein
LKGSAVGLNPSPSIRVRHFARRVANSSAASEVSVLSMMSVEVRGVASAVVCTPSASAVPLLAARKPRRDQRVVMTAVSSTLTFKRSITLTELSISIVY